MDKTSQEIARQFGVTERTIRRDGQYAAAVDRLGLQREAASGKLGRKAAPGTKPTGVMQTPTTTPQGFHLGRPRAFMRNAPWDGQQYHGSGASFTEIPMSEVDNPKVTTITPAHRPRNPSGMTTFPSGAVRGCDADGERYDLITPVGLRRLAETCAEGAAKYGDHNWLKGSPLSQMLNHGIRHLYLYLHGDATEDHLAHAAWNILGAMHFEEQMPEMIDIPTRRQPKTP